MKRNWRRGFIGGLSFSSALFVFQACYGMPQDFQPDLLVSGQVKSKMTGLPIKGLQVSVKDCIQFELTDQEGKFSFYTEWMDQLTLRVEDIDSTVNGSFNARDTVLIHPEEIVNLDILMEEK